MVSTRAACAHVICRGREIRQALGMPQRVGAAKPAEATRAQLRNSRERVYANNRVVAVSINLMRP